MNGLLVGAFLGIWQGMCTLTPPYNQLDHIPMRFSLTARQATVAGAAREYDYTIEYVGLQPPRRYLLKEATDQCPGCLDLDEQNGIVLRETLSADGQTMRSVFSVDANATTVHLIDSNWRVLPADRQRNRYLTISLITRRVRRAVPIKSGPVIADQQCLLQKL